MANQTWGMYRVSKFPGIIWCWKKKRPNGICGSSSFSSTSKSISRWVESRRVLLFFDQGHYIGAVDE